MAVVHESCLLTLCFACSYKLKGEKTFFLEFWIRWCSGKGVEGGVIPFSYEQFLYIRMSFGFRIFLHISLFSLDREVR